MNKIKKAKKKIFSFMIISSVLLVPLFLLINPNTTITTELDIDVDDDVSIEPKTSAIVDGTMTHTMFPIVLSYDTYPDIYEKLEFKDYSMIRVGYYGENDQWEWVPFQIDEIGKPYVWVDKATDMERALAGTGFPEPGVIDAYIPFGDPNGRGFDQYIPGKLDFNDEMVFYAYNGHQVDSSFWGLPEYEHRFELEIQDGSGGTGWMYLYISDTSDGRNNSIAHEPWYEEYISYDEDNLEIETDVYKLKLHPQNFDLYSSIKIMESNDPTNLVDEFDKQNSCNNLLKATDLDFFYSTTEGTWDGTFHDVRNKALDDPSDDYNYDGERAENNLAYGPTENNDISNKGDHKASCQGPIRVILQFPCFEYTYSGTVSIGGFIGVEAKGFTQGYDRAKYYYDRLEVGGGGDNYAVQPDADFCLLYKYNDIVSLNNEIKNNLTVYYGADPLNPHYSSFTSGLKTCIPDGNGGNDDYNSGGNPIQGASSNHPENTDMADWSMVTSDEFGGFWKYLGREAFESAVNIDQTNIYWRDTADLTEMGMHYEKYGNGLVSSPVSMPSFNRITIFGNFSSSNVADGEVLFNQQELSQSNTLISSTFSDKPNMPFFVSINADQTSYKNGSTITFNIKCDDDNYTIYGDFSELDSNFNEANVGFQNLGNNLYKINYTISSDNNKVPGKYYVNLTADDGHPSSINNTRQKYIAYYTHDEKFLSITSVVTQPTVTDVYPGQTYYASVNITNPTFFDVTITSLSLDFTYFNDEWGNAKSNFTHGSPTPGMPYTISENTTAPITFNLSFSLDANTPPGLVSVNASIDKLTIDFTEDSFSHYGSESPCVVNVIDNTAPNLPRRPGNLTLVEGSESSYIKWIWFDYKPAFYNITEDGALNKSATAWDSGDPIEFEVAAGHLGLGTFNYTIYINDTSNNAAWSDVSVEVTSDPLAISEEYDVIYTYGENEPNLTWTPSWDPTDGAPDTYTIKKDGVVVQSGSWDSSGITYDIVTGYWVGNYTIICNISNDKGYWVNDTVKVTVLNDIPELSSSHVTLLDGVRYVSGSIGNKLVWTVSDKAYNVTLNSYNVTRNGIEYQTNSWVASVPINVNIDGLLVATYNFTIYVEDGLGGTVYDSVLVRVIENKAPKIEISYDKLEFDVGSTAVEIKWEISDKYYNSTSCSYTITVNSTLVQSGTWQITGDVGYISYAFDNHTQLEIGTYIFLLTVNDGYGGEETHQLIVQVNEKIILIPKTLIEQLLESLRPFIAFLAILYVGRVIQKRRRISVKKVKLADPVYQSRRGIELDKKYDDKKEKDDLILEDSIRQFKYASMIDPKLPEPHYNLAIALMEKGQITESIAEFKKVISLNPEFAEAHNNLGIALCLNGDFEEAIASFEEALKINPDFTEAKSNLETAKEDKGGEYWSRFGVR